MSIRRQLADYTPWKLRGLMTPTAESKLVGAAEDLCSEVFNPGNETAVFENIHPLRSRMWFHGKPPEYWMRLECPPGEWLFLPHASYRFSVPSGHRAYRMTQNFGDQMFVGNKLPSRPEVSKMRSFVPNGRS